MSFLDTTVLVRDPDLIATERDGDIVMMSFDQGGNYGNGGAGTRVWDLLAQSIVFSDIIETICSEFDVEESVCRSDLQAYMEKLLLNRLVKID